jgi:hypothetical protein
MNKVKMRNGNDKYLKQELKVIGHFSKDKDSI